MSRNLEIMQKLYGDNLTPSESADKWASLMDAYGKLRDFLEGMEDIAPNEEMCDYFQEKKYQLSRVAEIVTNPELYIDGYEHCKNN